MLRYSRREGGANEKKLSCSLKKLVVHTVLTSLITVTEHFVNHKV